MKKSPFFKRVVAFILDILIISIFAGLVAMPFSNADKTKELHNELNKVSEKYIAKEIGIKKYYFEATGINYEILRNDGVSSIVSLLFTILYFIVFQFYNKGQTIGKKLMRIKVVSAKGNNLTINNLVLRSLIINTIVFDMVLLFIVFLGKKGIYTYASMSLEIVQYILIITTVFLVIFRKDGRGVHDFLGSTMVVEEV